MEQKSLDTVLIKNQHISAVVDGFEINGVTDTDLKEEQFEELEHQSLWKEITGEELILSPSIAMPKLMDPFFQKVGLACLAGGSDIGKSTFARQLALDIASGKDEFVGFKLNAKHRSAIYISTEDFYEDTQYLVKKQASGINPSEAKGLRFVFDWESPIENLDRSLSSDPADLVVIDSLGDLVNADLKDTQKLRSFLIPYQKLAVKHRCLVLFVHHTSKRSEKLEPSKNNLLSGQGLEAKMRCVLELRQDAVESDLRHLCCVKANYLSAVYKNESYVLELCSEDLTFKNTGERVSFDQIKSGQDEEDRQSKYRMAIKLQRDGKTLDDIADKLGYSHRGSVSKLIKQGSEKGWPE